MAYFDFYLLSADDGGANIAGRCKSYEPEQDGLTLTDVIFHKGIKLRRLEQLSSPKVVVKNTPTILIQRSENEDEQR
jgi:hypothetical protein